MGGCSKCQEKIIGDYMNQFLNEYLPQVLLGVLALMVILVMLHSNHLDKLCESKGGVRNFNGDCIDSRVLIKL